jgi:hypothetical protein
MNDTKPRYTTTSQHVSEPAEPFTSDDDRLSYGSVVSPNPQVLVTRVARPRATLAQKLRLRSPGHDEVREERWTWTTSGGELDGFGVSYSGWSPTFEEAWAAAGEVKTWWADKWDRRPSTLRIRAELEARGLA